MKREEAQAGIAYLAACTPGWTQVSVEMYVGQCERFQDPDAFLVAMKNLALRWDKPSRPLPHDITVAYNATAQQMDLDQRDAITDGHSSSNYPTFEEGLAIARESYVEYCRTQGREPDLAYFDRTIRSARE